MAIHNPMQYQVNLVNIRVLYVSVCLSVYTLILPISIPVEQRLVEQQLVELQLVAEPFVELATKFVL